MIGSSALPSKAVSPLAFVAAPRYHSGGIVGLEPGKVPIIAKEGEEVLRRDNPRHIDNLGNAGGVDKASAVGAEVERALGKMRPNRILSVIDPNLVRDNSPHS